MTQPQAEAGVRPHCVEPTACKAKGVGAHCRTCANRIHNADPEKLARVAASLVEHWADPAAREAHSRRTRAGVARSLAQPGMRERRQRAGREHGKQNLELTRSPECRAKAGASIRAVKLAWCPPAYWPRNDKLKRQGHRLTERQAIIRAEIAAASIAGLDHDLAAAHLRRLAPTMRCDAAGRPDPVGTHYRYGSAVKTRVELVQLAIAKGWKPEAGL